MKNILFISHSAELNGAELWLLETLKRINREKYQPMLIVPEHGLLEEQARKLGIDVFLVPMKWWITEKAKIWRQPFAWIWNAKSVKRIAQIIRTKRIDLVLTNSAAVSGGAFAAKKAGVPHVWAIHEVLRGERPLLYYLFGSRRLVKFIERRSLKVIVNSNASRTAFQNLEKTALIYNGLQARKCDPSRLDSLRRELGIHDGDLVAGVLGKIYEGKGQREVVQAAARLLPEYPRLKVLMIGDVRNGRYLKDVKNIVKENKMEASVIFTGYRTDLPEVMALLDVLVVASVVESFGRAALEAMAAGLPVLAVNAGGLPEIVEHGLNGFLMESRDPEVIARALREIFQSPDKVRNIVHCGYRTVREKFSMERQIAGVERVLDEILAGREN
jgi:glycosyltransferase involved in cell wall biosynthesis